MSFQLQSSYDPAGDQITAIQQIGEGFGRGEKNITLLGATGTGKTFTMANIIQHLQKPTLIISHNKTLAAQLATEFKYFFPNNAVHYFVSYFDYYQPESYLADKDIYIEKEATINQEIEMYRLGTMASLLTREDVIVVSSVSALYGLGEKEFFEKYSLHFQVGQIYHISDIKKTLIAMQYEPVHGKIEPGMFDVAGDMVDIFSSTEHILYRLYFNEYTLEAIEKRDRLTFESMGMIEKCMVRPSSQYMQDLTDLDMILHQIEAEMDERVHFFKSHKKDIEANRIAKKVMYDIRMIRETGFVNGIENYSSYFDGRVTGASPNTIFDYFPDDMLLIMDESHMSVPQLRSMPAADATRKTSLIEHGFRLPSAIDHRPLNFTEVETMLGWSSSTDADELFNTPKPSTPSKLDLSI